MSRIDLIQNLIDKYSYSKYLEIGTFRGESFFPIKCKKKIAVDPHFLFSKKDRIKWIAKNKYNIKNSYYQMDSDTFFEEKKKVLLRKKIDIVFIDGLHTFKASLNDALNSLSILNNGGTIVLHDCLPPHKAAAKPASSYNDAYEQRSSDWTGEWCGDVWKTIIYLKRKYPSGLKVFTVDNDYGLGVVRPEKKDLDFEIDLELFEDINNKDYMFLKSDYRSLLNLKPQNFIK